ncbi:MAG: 4Fe-4S dicluster domain-containing protein [Lentisphaerae bacterium]|nr:4Fe-4S dicluster domain-containing protein [Lentisphaerota bacterium]
MSRKFRVLINSTYCKACELCVAVCPKSVLAVGRSTTSKGIHCAETVAPDSCIGCKACSDICPEAAIEIRVEGDGQDRK